MKTCCVIVCYFPNVEVLSQLCYAITSDGGQVILVDNTESPTLTGKSLPSGCSLITLGSNTGIAHAQNVGVNSAIAAGAEVVAFFDQDSTIKTGFLTTLVSELSLGKPDIVSPLYVDDTSNSALPSTKVSRNGVTRTVHHSESSEPYLVDVVISSGTAASVEVFEVAGFFDEDFFIDFVDTEWCLRCRSKMIPIRVIPRAVMKNRIGSRSLSIGFSTVFVHSPIRCYYQIRNCFLLFRKRHVPILFAMRELITVFYNRTLLLFIVDQKTAYFKAYSCALIDGVRGLTGIKPK
jgi:rhamnosyltransferase